MQILVLHTNKTELFILEQIIVDLQDHWTWAIFLERFVMNGKQSEPKQAKRKHDRAYYKAKHYDEVLMSIFSLTNIWNILLAKNTHPNDTMARNCGSSALNKWPCCGDIDSSSNSRCFLQHKTCSKVAAQCQKCQHKCQVSVFCIFIHI